MAIGYDAGPIYPNDSGGEVYALPTQPAQLSTARTTGEWSLLLRTLTSWTTSITTPTPSGPSQGLLAHGELSACRILGRNRRVPQMLATADLRGIWGQYARLIGACQ